MCLCLPLLSEVQLKGLTKFEIQIFVFVENMFSLLGWSSFAFSHYKDTVQKKIWIPQTMRKIFEKCVNSVQIEASGYFKRILEDFFESWILFTPCFGPEKFVKSPFWSRFRNKTSQKTSNAFEMRFQGHVEFFLRDFCESWTVFTPPVLAPRSVFFCKKSVLEPFYDQNESKIMNDVEIRFRGDFACMLEGLLWILDTFDLLFCALKVFYFVKSSFWSPFTAKTSQKRRKQVSGSLWKHFKGTFVIFGNFSTPVLAPKSVFFCKKFVLELFYGQNESKKSKKVSGSLWKHFRGTFDIFGLFSSAVFAPESVFFCKKFVLEPFLRPKRVKKVKKHKIRRDQISGSLWKHFRGTFVIFGHFSTPVLAPKSGFFCKKSVLELFYGQNESKKSKKNVSGVTLKHIWETFVNVENFLPQFWLLKVSSFVESPFWTPFQTQNESKKSTNISFVLNQVSVSL